MPVPETIRPSRLRQVVRIAVRVAVPAVIVAALGVILSGGFFRSSETVTGGEIWICSMHPQVRLPRPGKCPICGMTLSPLDQSRGAATEIHGVETETVSRRELARELRTVGRIDYNEARVEEITARVAGRVDRLFADFTGIRVSKGDHLVEIYSPDLYSAQQELITLADTAARTRASNRSSADRLSAEMLRSAREKLGLWGLTPQQITEIEQKGAPRTHLTIFSPLGGTVIEKNVRLGQYVEEGDSLYRIADLEVMWLYLELYEYDVGWIQYGQPADVVLEAYPGETFRGTVVFIDPFLNEETRTVRVRVNLPNPAGRLKAGMYATAAIRAPLLADGSPAPTGLEGKFFCPMHPEVVSEKTGTCPICGMELISVPARPRPKLAAAPVEDSGRPTATTAGDGMKPLAIRSSAVLDTGRRQIAYRRTKSGYELVELKLGPLAIATDAQASSGTFYPVLSGLDEGDEVVVRGGFLLDSQTQIEGRPSLLAPEGQSAANLHSGHSMPGSKPPTTSPANAGHQH